MSHLVERTLRLFFVLIAAVTAASSPSGYFEVISPRSSEGCLAEVCSRMARKHAVEASDNSE
jgi:hypothetical protein